MLQEVWVRWAFCSFLWGLRVSRLLSGLGHFMADLCKEKAGKQSGMVSLLKVIFNIRLFGNRFSVL